jgi:Na+/H+ antiporter NhaC
MRGMTLLALTIKAHTGVRLAEVGEALGAIGGLALLLGAVTPSRRAAQAVAGLALAAGFVLLVIATRWGHFH